MSDSRVKIRLRSGSREIEIEASRGDVDELLANWWSVQENLGNTLVLSQEGESEERPEAATPTRNGKPRKKSAARRQSTASSQDGATTWSPNDLANKIKEHPRFDVVEKKIIHADREFYNRAAFVISQADEALTSGQVHRVLEALHVRVGLPRISTALSTNKRNFITATGDRNVVTYSLTARARAELDKWLLADEE